MHVNDSISIILPILTFVLTTGRYECGVVIPTDLPLSRLDVHFG